jgi:hypothetical protein
MLVSLDQNAGQKLDIKIENTSIEDLSQFKYLGTTVTNQNLIEEEIKRRLNSANVCYHSVHSLAFSSVVRNVKVRIFKTNFSCGSIWL